MKCNFNYKNNKKHDFIEIWVNERLRKGEIYGFLGEKFVKIHKILGEICEIQLKIQAKF